MKHASLPSSNSMNGWIVTDVMALDLSLAKAEDREDKMPHFTYDLIAVIYLSNYVIRL